MPKKKKKKQTTKTAEPDPIPPTKKEWKEMINVDMFVGTHFMAMAVITRSNLSSLQWWSLVRWSTNFVLVLGEPHIIYV